MVSPLRHHHNNIIGLCHTFQYLYIVMLYSILSTALEARNDSTGSNP